MADPAEIEPVAGASGDASPDPDAEGLAQRSLFEDVEALIDDGRTYLEAEIGFQRARVAFIADGAKSALVLGAIALVFVSLALVGLTVGAIIALTPLLGAWGAAALVVGLLLLGAGLCVWRAARKWRAVISTFDHKDAGE